MALDLINLSKTFSPKDSNGSISVLEQLQYSIGCGRFVTIVGPSGCGKTTLLRIIAGLDRPSGGNVLLEGKELLPGSEEIGFVFQEYALFPWRTTLQNIEFGLEIRGIDRVKRYSKAMEYIQSFNLSGFENRYPKELSGGMKQRVAIARTLIMNPRVILMDEPFGALDSQTRNDLQVFLLNIWEKFGITILFVTHNVDEAVFLSDEIIVFSRRPARIARVFQVDVERPRDRTSAECNRIRKAVLKLLENEDSQ
jgi:NitT/TauT family transport system ATP-binding protein